MIAVDTNILIYAHREEFPKHTRAVERLSAIAAGPAPWGVPVFCLGEFVRVVTHRKVLTPPSSIEQALAFLDALATSPTYAVLLPDAEYATDLRHATTTGRASGNLVFDAQIAALCSRQGAVLLTDDRDFGRFAIDTMALEA